MHPVYDRIQEPLHFMNVHHGLKHPEKMNSHKLVTEIFQNISKNEGGIGFITGDFNSFPGKEGEDELNVLHQAGYKELLNDLKTHNSVPISGTFVGYSFDPFQCPNNTFGAQLDHIYTTAPEKINSHSCYINTQRYDGSDRENPANEAEILQDADGNGMHDKFPSDHLFGTVWTQVNTGTSK